MGFPSCLTISRSDIAAVMQAAVFLKQTYTQKATNVVTIDLQVTFYGTFLTSRLLLYHFTYAHADMHCNKMYVIILSHPKHLWCKKGTAK